MTAEEFFRKKWGGKSYDESIADGTQPHGLALYGMMKEYALQVAREAVEEAKESYSKLNSPITDIALDKILTRIESKLEES